MQKPWKRVRRFLKKLKIELPCYPAIPLLGMRVELLQSLLTLGNPMDWSPQGSVHGIPRQEYQTGLSYLPPRIFPTQGSNLQLLHCSQIQHCWATREAHVELSLQFIEHFTKVTQELDLLFSLVIARPLLLFITRSFQTLNTECKIFKYFMVEWFVHICQKSLLLFSLSFINTSPYLY